MKHLYLFAIFAFSSITLFSQDLILGFGLNQYSISNYSDSVLNSRLPEFKFSDSINVIGHTDTVGTMEFNVVLSRKRAESVMQWLVSKNVKPDIIKTYWKGESEILDFKCDEFNRRVEIFTFKNQHRIDTLQDQTFNKESQAFTIDNSRDTTIYGKEGTFIQIPMNSISSTKASDNKHFVVKLAEYYTLSDIILNHLTTRADKNILETKGMINLRIVQDGQECFINKNIPIKVGFPNTEKSEAEMSLFYGKPNQDNEIIWEEAQNSDDYSLPIYILVEEMPSFPGGETERIKFFAANIVYPQQAMEKGIEGTVYISFIVDSSGGISDAKILRSIGGGCDEEVLRVIKMIPRWNPGKQNGKNVAVLFTMPLFFRLNGNGQFAGNQLEFRNSMYSPVYDSTFKKASINAINNYIFNVLSLGWINCDRYLYEGMPKGIVNVSLKSSLGISAYMIFTKSKSVLSGKFKNGFYSFSQIPKGEEIIFIGIQKVNGKCYFAQKSGIISTTVESLDNFEEISFDDLNSRIDGIRKSF
jgi:TonB family protein